MTERGKFSKWAKDKEQPNPLVGRLAGSEWVGRIEVERLEDISASVNLYSDRYSTSKILFAGSKDISKIACNCTYTMT